MSSEMKDKIHKEYNRRVRQLTSVKLNGGNTIRGVNYKAVSLIDIVLDKMDKIGTELYGQEDTKDNNDE